MNVYKKKQRENTQNQQLKHEEFLFKVTIIAILVSIEEKWRKHNFFESERNKNSLIISFPTQPLDEVGR